MAVRGLEVMARPTSSLLLTVTCPPLISAGPNVSTCHAPSRTSVSALVSPSVMMRKLPSVPMTSASVPLCADARYSTPLRSTYPRSCAP